MRKCPCCNGSGMVADPVTEKQKAREDRQTTAIMLQKQGYTIRQIAGVMGFKNPGSVSNLLDPIKHKKGKHAKQFKI